MNTKFILFASSISVLSLTGCGTTASNIFNKTTTVESPKATIIAGISNFKQATKPPYTVLDGSTPDGAMSGKMMEIRNGGYGSDSVSHPTKVVDSNSLYIAEGLDY